MMKRLGSLLSRVAACKIARQTLLHAEAERVLLDTEPRRDPPGPDDLRWIYGLARDGWTGENYKQETHDEAYTSTE